jgi:hypothetical protein
MNVQEFAALKVGDKIDNAMSSSQGEVTEVNAQGVRVRWGLGNTGAITFLYTVQSTAWFHWSKVEAPTEPDALELGAAVRRAGLT